MPSKTTSTSPRLIKIILKEAADRLRDADFPSPELDAELLLAHLLNTDRSFLFIHDDDTLTASQYADFKQLIVQRLRHYPVAYLIGHKEFYGLDFLVTPDVLVPRPESELMVELARQEVKLDSLLIDLGTGSGCIAIALAPYFPKIVAIDISIKALAIAKKNAKRLGVQHTHFYQGNLLDHFKNFNAFSHIVITANLPYVTPAEIKKEPSISREPKLALDGGPDGLDIYRELSGQITELEKQHYIPITLLCEINPQQKSDFQKIWKGKKVEFHKDLAGKIRVGKIEIKNGSY